MAIRCGICLLYTSLTAIPPLVGYLRRQRPDALLVAKDRAGRAALRARWLSGVPTRVVVRLGTNLSRALAERSWLNRWLRTAPMRRVYAGVDAVIAVSDGVRRDTLAITALPPERVVTLRNPVVTPAFLAQAQAPCPHPWLTADARAMCPVIMGIGRLSGQKDFATLIHAFALLAAERPLRLIIVGEGSLRPSLSALVDRLGLTDRVLLPGFQAELPAWLARASVFVLCSRWEGSPNVLTEALALGVPCVATACPSGPDEVLQAGRYGPLVPVGDVAALAAGVEQVLLEPLPAATLQKAVAAYHASLSAEAYLRVLAGES